MYIYIYSLSCRIIFFYYLDLREPDEQLTTSGLKNGAVGQQI